MTASVLYDAPGPRTRLRNRIYTVVGSLALAGLLVFFAMRLNSKGEFKSYMWDLFQYAGVQQQITDGVVATLKAFALAAVFSLLLATVFAAGRLSDHKPVRIAASAAVEFFRALPLIIMIYLLWATVFEPFWALVIGLTLYNGSVQAEIFRAGINSVPKGQSEAAYALGMRKTQVMLTILVPQAVRAMLPSIISQLVVTLKDTSLGYLIAYTELLYVGRILAGNTPTLGNYPYFQVLLVIGTIYIAMCMLLSAVATWVEKRARRSPKGAPPATPEAEALVATAE
ncbi:amino acid ABC transporter permease [Streptomyces sp. SID13666]|uniref:amino acid ABC transporter permease n=1 Tax=Streptomyces TaxID=1883 RepID=UPI001106AE69|nr:MULTISPECIES: amino acid ABC transporter permease [Streptomyces]MCZ4095502.1 amino acid ABC transporter permease [Streptomyces sp. H39-C1]NEA55023.1 amino acid ABC transporter permease [Streptomyces sp. SID13666]NEA71030.1 amino acid ABC transporter permease [Streptomyces sp. SID13588]QNA75729.1 amino acid ABC transporter permease [Streptomyces sp. So13.3]